MTRENVTKYRSNVPGRLDDLFFRYRRSAVLQSEGMRLQGKSTLQPGL